MDKIIGTNLGNWLVLEKWMQPEFFEGTGAEDETWLNRKLNTPENGAAFEAKMKAHRDTYVTKEDFEFIRAHGMNTVRIPVPYFIFGDYGDYIGCIEYLDRAFDWAEETGLKILVDLHTSPGCQNGYDNGGLTGVCKFGQKAEDVEFVLMVLERLAERYAAREALFGIEVLNEPISWIVYATAPSTGKAADKEEAKGSKYMTMPFLKKFYTDAYARIRKYLPEDKAVVFHDGFRLRSWNKFFKESGMKNVYLDTHIYIFAMEKFVPFPAKFIYSIYLGIDRMRLRATQKAIPVIVGEWCVSTRYCNNFKQGNLSDEEYKKARNKRFLEIYDLENRVWDETAGYFYWNYQLGRDPGKPMDEIWKESWDLKRNILSGRVPDIMR